MHDGVATYLSGTLTAVLRPTARARALGGHTTFTGIDKITGRACRETTQR